MANPDNPHDDGSAMETWPTGRLLSTAARTVEHAWAEALDRRGLTHAGIIVLHLLADGQLSQADLSRRARVQMQTMSRTIERLEREGLISRDADPADRRRVRVRRTPAGDAAWAATQNIEADLFPALADPAALRRALLQVIAAASDRRWDDHPA